MPEQQLPSGITLHVEDEGTGPPIVFVHGWSMSGRFFQRQVPHFSTSNRVLVPDLRGHGRSEKVLHGHTVTTYARDLREVLEARGVARPLLVGWSMGAMVAYEYLRQFDQDVAGLVVVDQPPSDFAWEGYEFGVFTIDLLAQTNQQIQLDQPGLAQEFAELMLHAPDEETMAWMVEEICRVPPAIASAILLDQTLQDYRPFLPEIRVPTLVMFGEDPKLTNPAAGEYTTAQIPGARFRAFPDSSHCPFWEEADAFYQVVAGFASALW
jgi:non-heme chloroperoxidase